MKAVFGLLLAALILGACVTQDTAPEKERLSRLQSPPHPADNPATPEKIALGRQLFYDARLSDSGKASCESCHYRHLGWTDAKALSTRVNGVVNPRHTPTLYNVAYQRLWYWDGRSATLEAQITAAWVNQMVTPDTKVIAERLETIPGYRSQFQSVFGSGPTPQNIVQALAAFIRTLASGDSPWDRHEKGVRGAVSADAVAGFELFMGKARCAICHTPPVYSDGNFHNIGLEAGKPKPDLGRGAISKDAKENSAFKTPTLRSVAISGPYFHDGSVANLEDAVRLMAQGGRPDPNRSPLLLDAKLTDREIGQVVEFLRALTSDEPAVKPILP